MKKHIIIGSILLAVAGCDLEVGDLNNPGIDQLEENPTPSAVSAACTGLLIGSRSNVAQANGYVAQLGILGREAYNFDQADPRFIGELLAGDLNGGSPFGGNFWAQQYANLRLGDLILHAVDQVAEYTPGERAAITGFVKTLQALDLLEVTVTRDTNGVVIDTDHEIDVLAPIVDVDQAYAKIEMLLDDGAAALDDAGDAEFPFDLSGGYAGFDTAVTFRTFNRAIRARVAAYTGDYAAVTAALAESFLDDTVTTIDGLYVGVYHTFSTGAGDQVNNLINPNIYAHPSLEIDAMSARAGGGTDPRYTRKTTMAATPGAAQGLSSNRVFTIYSSPSSPVPIIRNEELILLRAEAAIQSGGSDGTADINIVRVANGLPVIVGPATLDDLLYEREMSLMFEGGFRWIDARRFDRVDQLPTDGFDHINIRYPIPLGECNARPANEPACMLGSR